MFFVVVTPPAPPGLAVIRLGLQAWCLARSQADHLSLVLTDPRTWRSTARFDTLSLCSSLFVVRSEQIHSRLVVKKTIFQTLRRPEVLLPKTLLTTTRSQSTHDGRLFWRGC